MQVSVIIPVYNAAPFLDKCIQSALNQRQTGEIILIDDRSTDGSWESCQAWKKKESKIKIFRNEGVKGAGAARNIGLRNATCEYIAFLDADDYYLDGRFDEAQRLFNKKVDIDGVAESTLVRFENENNSKVISGNFKIDELLGCQQNNIEISPTVFLKHSNLLITAITLKGLSVKNYCFDTMLKQTQDTDFILSIIRSKRIVSGIYYKPVAVYYFHESNTTKKFYDAAYYRHLFFRKHFRLCLRGCYSLCLCFYFLLRYIEYSYQSFNKKIIFSKKIDKFINIPYYLYLLYAKPIK